MKRVFVIAEAGSNWRMGTLSRDLKMARTLIDAAAEAGADAVKFQTYRAETVYVPNAGTSDYLSQNGIRESITDIFKDLSMPYEMIPELYKYCKRRNIEFMTSVFSENDFKATDKYVSRHKIASYEISHAHLIELAAKSKKPLILSTGGATFSDTDWAVDYFKKNGGKDISLMQCTAKYPAPVDSLNLSVIPELIKRYNVPVGLSDHSRDPLLGPIAAVALGASIIEKHYTLHNNLPGPDHAFAITSEELKNVVKAVRDCEKALGKGKKIVLPVERELRKYAQRSLQAIKKIQKGDVFKEGVNIAILRSGKQKQGIHPRFLSSVLGKRSRRVISLGDGIQRGDYA